jgi:nucleoside-diphosphate-sugar epimerase
MKILLIGSQGYIGTYLYEKFAQYGYEIHGIDLNGSKNRDQNLLVQKYQNLDVNFLSKYSIVLFFAGVSSVKSANDNPMYTIEQNTIDMWNFAKLCDDARVRLIYASSGSVYADNTGNLLFTASETTLNSYDASKLAFDLVVRYANANALGLRMGTVSGWSMKIRPELIFNSMCISAIEKKKIYVSNPQNYRSILFLDDLFSILLRLLNEVNVLGQIPCSSYSGTIGQIAAAIANHFSAEVELLDGNSTYSFALKKSSFDSVIPPSLDEECNQFYKLWKASNAK